MDFDQNKLLFPAGASPGIDDINNPLESTLPFGGEVFAPVASGNGYVDIASGRRGVPTGTPVFTIDQDIGPGCKFSGTQDFQWAGMPSWTAVATAGQGLHTIAAIVKVTTENALTKTILLLDTAATTDTPFLSLSGTEVLSAGFWGGTASALPGLRLGEPYFLLAAHVPDIGANGRLFFLQKSLRTGEVRSKLTAMAANSLSRAGGTWSIGNAGGTRAFVGHIAAAWYSSSRLAFGSSVATTELLVGAYSQLADDPWSLWYRRKPRTFSSTTAGGVTNYTLTAAAGAFTFAGTATRLAFGHALPAVKGTLAFAGPATRLAFGRALPAVKGTLAFAGTVTRLAFGHALPAVKGTLAFTGSVARLAFARTMSAVAGAFVLSGKAASLSKTGSYGILASTGVLSFTRVDANLRAARNLTSTVGVFTLTGLASNLVVTAAGRRLVAAVGALLLTGKTVNLVYTQPVFSGIMALRGIFVLSGREANLLFKPVPPRRQFVRFVRPVIHTARRW